MVPFFIFLLAIMAGLLEAHRPYTAYVFVDEAKERVTATNLVDLQRELSFKALAKAFPGYHPDDAVAMEIDLRGIRAAAVFEKNSTTLLVSIPDADLFEIFTAATRDGSLALFKDYLKEAGRHHRLLKAYARFSPIDPMGGNPTSLMAVMAQRDFLLGGSCFSCCPSFLLGGYLTRAFSHGFDTTTVTLPLSYRQTLPYKSTLFCELPVTFQENGGAYSLFGSLALALAFPLVENRWQLMALSRLGAGGSMDLACAGNFASFGVKSEYTCPARRMDIILTNYAGYFSSTNFWLSGINCNYHLHNWIFKNGLTLALGEGINLCAKELFLSAFVVDTVFSKDPLYVRHYDEVGGSLALCRCFTGADRLSLRLSYFFGEKSFKGYSLYFTYEF